MEGGINTYVYVGGNPVNRVDPTGESTTTIGGYIGGLCGGPVGAGIGAGIGSLIGVGIYYYFFDDCGGGGGESDGGGCFDEEDRKKRCMRALGSCWAAFGTNIRKRELCKQSYFKCITTNQPVLFPDGTTVK